MGQSNAKEDAQRYRDGYPGDVDDPTQNYNLDFYTGKIRSMPDGTRACLPCSVSWHSTRAGAKEN